MGCGCSKRSTLDDYDTDYAYTSIAQPSASSSLYFTAGSPSSLPKTDKGYGQRRSMQAFVSQNYEGFGQSQSASSTSLPKEPHSHTPVSQNRQGHGHTPKETDDRYKSPAVESVASSSSSFPEESKINHASGFELKKYSFKELAEATEHFSNNKFLGEGAFGQVFKANLDGKEVAIKKLKMVLMDTEVDHSDEQPKNLEKLLEELDVLRIVNHPNVVKMVGYCNEQKNKLLVLEYVANKSLRFHLNGKKPLVWSNRMKIAIGSAKGLQYLHKECDIRIIHRDIKADNILLTNDFEPKVADFSLAKFLPNATNVSHITSILRGTNV
ncbi:putative proline-rich receptor-like protein kinase PERK6 [Manihot esculenta]|uniref:putative proline-rich receptor-like protein kinase PERK6 n=1 Tax=Manihot esculenta TaxID=3983 RepID=UPI001CC3BDB9|nr:putative proline-rich receptor-like protein kinase PERK6 [Manihot esculenta]